MGSSWISVADVRSPTIPLRWIALALITALAATLRLVDLGAVRLDPFYDAAVRSMGVSWHNFFFGAYEPGGSVSIDKPPVDLWLQVASVKLFGWGSTSLKLPEALAGTLSVPLLYAAIKRPFGAIAGLVAALALAVLPIEVITARSDTMDAVMMLLLVMALLMVVRACETGKTAWLLAGAAMLGVAFNVKLLESVVALPGLFALAWLGLPRTSQDSRAAEFARRAAKFAAAATVYVVVALLWLGATLLFPTHERPYAIGSTNGSAWNAAFVFNGSERLSGKTAEVGVPIAPHGRGSGELASTGTPITPPSPTRLLARSGQLPAKWLGWEALTALLLGIAVVISVLRGKAGRVQRATAIGVFVWLLTGLVLFSAMARLHPRYVESFTPAVAAMFGIGVGLLAALQGRMRLLALPLTALLAVPLVASVEAVEAKTSDAGNVGALNPSRAARAQHLPARPSEDGPLRAGRGILDKRRFVDRAGSTPRSDAHHLQRHPLHKRGPAEGVDRPRRSALRVPRFCLHSDIAEDDGRLRPGRAVDTHPCNRHLAPGGPARGRLWQLPSPMPRVRVRGIGPARTSSLRTQGRSIEVRARR